MSTDISGVSPGGSAVPPAEAGTQPVGAPQQQGPYAQVAAQTRPSFWRRPLGIVLIVLMVLGLGVGLLIGVFAMFVFSAAQPLNQVMLDDFATAGDSPMTEEEGLSWDQSNGTLNLYPTDTSVQTLHFTLPEASNEMRVEATLIEPAYADPAAMLWGVALFNSDTKEGVALLCSSGGTMFLADANTGQPLPMGETGTACQETMTMTLEASGRVLAHGPDTTSLSVYSGNAVYGNLDTVGVLVAAEKPGQVLRVSKIAAYQ